MFQHWLKKLVVIISFVGLMAFVAVTASEAMPLTQTPLPDDCQECHESIQIHWEESAHGQALVNESFQVAWQEEGSPDECLACHTTGYDAATGMYQAAGITCEACHALDPNSTHHPEQMMPVDRSSQACGSCHLDTHEEWQTSMHADEGLTCVRCHNPHTTELKADSVQELCMACHNEESYFYSFTGHAAEGLLCTDCHLRVTEMEGEGHGAHEHTFGLDLATCNECHDQEMHSPEMQMFEGLISSSGGPVVKQVMNNMVATCTQGSTTEDGKNVAHAAEVISLSNEPDTGSRGPFEMVVPAGIGLIFGMMMAPWMERWYRRANGRS